MGTEGLAIELPPEDDDDERDDEPTAVTQLHNELDQCLETSRKTLSEAARKGDKLRRTLRRPKSYQRLEAVLVKNGRKDREKG